MAISSLVVQGVRRRLNLSSSVSVMRSMSSICCSADKIASSSSCSSCCFEEKQKQKREEVRCYSSSSSRFSSNNNNSDEKISEDTILFEGCDYNHWLITMEFPKDPKPTPEQMVETYVQTLSKVVGSVEEANKRMYACSTTTYTGFQAIMSEEMSEKFQGLPGVVFILPDSYIDPVNKEYGGDKYINGTIIPRPPPVQYGRQGRFGDRNRPDHSPRPRYDNNPPPPPINNNNNNNYGPSQNFDNRRNFDQPKPNYHPHQNFPPNPPDTRNFQRQDNYVQRDTYQGPQRVGAGGFPQPATPDYAPPQNRDFRGDDRNFAPGGYNRQGPSSSYTQGYPPRQHSPQMGKRDGMQGEHQNFMPTGQMRNDQEEGY